MAKKKTQSKQRYTSRRPKDVAGQLEHAFLAGLGALSDAQERGAKTFESLVKQGEAFRKDATDKTEALISDVQDAIRGMAGGAQSKATGLLDQMRDASQLDKLNSVFDSRVASTMDRLGVPRKADIDALERKLDRVLRAVESKPSAKTVGSRKSKKRSTTKKAVRKASSKKVAKRARKTTAKKAAKKTASRKK